MNYSRLLEDTLLGGAGNDTLDATVGEGGNLLLGQEDDDLLKAGSNDILRGGLGNDQLFGGRGGSVLTGGPGADGLWIIDGALPEQMLEELYFVVNIIEEVGKWNVLRGNLRSLF